MAGYEIVIQSEIRLQTVSILKFVNRIFAFLVTVLELPYLPDGIAEGLRY